MSNFGIPLAQRPLEVRDEMSLKVVHVAYAGMSGISHVLREMLAGFNELGMESVLVAYQREPNEEQIRNEYKDANELLIRGKQSRADLKNIWGISKELRARDAAVIIHHDTRVALVDSIRWRINRKRGGKPILIHHAAKNMLGIPRKWEAALASLAACWNVAVGSNCVPLKGAFLPRLVGRKSSRINNTVEITNGLLDSSEFGDGTGIFEVTMVGRMVYQKDFETLIRAVKKANELPGERFIHLNVAGTGPDQKKIEDCLRELGDQEATFHGQLTPVDANALIKRSDTYVQSSRGEADLSTSVLVAMCNRVPVICTACPGINEDLKSVEPQVARLVAPESAPDLAEAIIELANDDVVHRSLAEAGRSYVEKSHDRQAVMQKWLVLIKELCDDK